MKLPIWGLTFLLLAQVAPAATFGTVVSVTGAPTDLVLDELRDRLYIVNATENRVDVYSPGQKRLLSSIPVDNRPVAAALSPDARYLYVACYGSSILDVVDLDAVAVSRRVALPAAPQAVAAGGDGRVLITTSGASSTDTSTRLLLFDPGAGAANSIVGIASSIPAPATPGTPSAGQVYNASRSLLVATPDGKRIIGANISSTTSETVFVYEVASASVLRSRTLSTISTVLSVSADGSKFSSGLSLFDTATLAIVAQQNAANSLYPFAQNVNFNTQSIQGGSVFAPDGSVLYSAFNTAPVSNAATAANTSQFMLSDADNLLIQLGLQLPENLNGKMVVSSSGAAVYALSQSGITVIPVATIYDNPIAAVDTTALILTNDPCGVTASTRTAQVNVTNRGKGRLTATAAINQNGVTFTFPIGGQPNAGPGVVIGGGGPGGGAGAGGPGQGIPIGLPGGGQQQIPPGIIPTATNTTLPTAQQNAVVQNAPILTMQPNANGATFKFSYNPAAATSIGTGTPADFVVQSPEAINIPARIRVYQNNRSSEAAGNVIAAAVSASTAEGLVDIVLDSTRQRLYVSNSGLNRLEVFDTRTNQFLAPIKVGQLPRSLALAPDGNTLYVANSGGESISIVDLDKGAATGSVKFPPLAYNSSATLVTPSVIAATLGGLQMIMSNGALWQVVNNEARPRPASTLIGSTTLTAPRTMVATPGGEYALLLAGSGVAYLYDAMSDEYVQSAQVQSTPIQGYYGPVAAGPLGRYYVVNGQLLNSSLTPVSATSGVAGPGFPGVPGGGPTATVSTTRPYAAVAAVNSTMFARFVQPTRASTTAAVATAPTVELVDATTGSLRGQGASALEGPLSTQTGTTRVNVAARTMAVDSTGSTAYLLTSSGLSIVPLSAAFNPQGRPSVNQNGVVNAGSYTTSIAPNSIVSIFGQNLGAEATASSTPLPTTLGGSCVTLDNVPIPLFMTSPSQVNAQIPPDTTVAKHSLVVHSLPQSLATAIQSVTVAKYAPAVLVNSQTGQAAVYHADGRAVSTDRPAKRDEELTMYAIGLGATTGGKATSGSPSPSGPLAVSDALQVYFGDPRYKEAAIIVEWSGLAPGLVGVYQVNLRVPGAHIGGDDVPVTLKVGGVSSPASGAGGPTLAVD